MKTCIIIPAYNESKNIGRLVESIGQKGLDVLVIDDGSTDGTGAIAKQKGARVICHNQKKGKGYSLREGFRYILEHDYQAVITMDGDGQHDTGAIDEFIQASEKQGISVIVGNRMTNPKGMPHIRYLTNCFMSWLISLACGQSIADTQCGYRYIHRDVLQAVKLTSCDFEIETEILMKASKKRFKIFNMPIKTIYCDEESKINPFKDTVRFFVYFIKEIFSSKR